MQKTRCQWIDEKSPKIYVDYHDTEWGKPEHNDQKLFEMLCLEGAQAGLSWITILKKRAGYREAFFNFDLEKCANLTDEYLESQRMNKNIVRNKLKIYSVRKNAIAVQKIQAEFGSFSKYLWNFTDHKTITTRLPHSFDYPTKNELTDTVAKDLKKRGCSFVGSTIIMAYFEAIGIFDHHMADCFCAR